MTTPHTKRNTLICTDHAAGMPLSLLCRKYNLGSQRIKQILQRGGVWRPREKTDRTEFLGIATDARTKRNLKANADALGISVSDYATRKLKEMLHGTE